MTGIILNNKLEDTIEEITRSCKWKDRKYNRQIQTEQSDKQ